MFDDKADATLFKGTEDECYEWINAHYPEESQDYNHIWIEMFYAKPSEDDFKILQEAINAQGLGNAIEKGLLKDEDISHQRISELIYEVHDAIRRIKKIIEQ